MRFVHFCIAAVALAGLHCVRHAILNSEPVMQRVALYHMNGVNASAYDVVAEALLVDDYLTSTIK